MTMCFDALHQTVTISPCNGCFTRGIGVGNDDTIGIIKAGRKLIKQRGQSRITMRLNNSDYFSRCRSARGLQHSRNFNRMMAVIIKDFSAIPLTCLGEATLDATKAFKRHTDRIWCHAKMIGNGNGCRCIQRIVMPRHWQNEIIDLRHSL